MKHFLHNFGQFYKLRSYIPPSCFLALLKFAFMISNQLDISRSKLHYKVNKLGQLGNISLVLAKGDFDMTFLVEKVSESTPVVRA